MRGSGRRHTSGRAVTRRPVLRRLVMLVLPAVLALVGASTAPVTGPERPASHDPARAVLREQMRDTSVLDADEGADAAVAASKALFESAPIVVLGPAKDETGMRHAGVVATKLGVPVLPASGGSGGRIARQLAGLSPRMVLTVGDVPSGRAEKLAGTRPVVATTGESADGLPDALPETQPPSPAEVTALVSDDRSDGAAAATARAAGARVLAVDGADPRADADTVEALRKHPPGTVLAVGAAFAPAKRLRNRLTTAANGEQLPGGGQTMFPGRRLVALYGHPGTPDLGALGEQGVDDSIDRVKRLAAHYDDLSDVPVVPAFEILATVASDARGPDGNYSAESTVDDLRPWVEKAGRAGLYVVLDLQPGRADLAKQAKQYKELLKKPYVGLAIDPEWKLGPHEKPLQKIGSVDAKEVNRVSSWLADFTAEHGLPQKLLVLHQFQKSMVRNEEDVDTDHDEVSVLVHMDGQGSPGVKKSSWQTVLDARPGSVPLGWKNFYHEDHPMRSPKQTMSYDPTPFMISYQ